MTPEREAQREAIRKAEEWERLIYAMHADEFCAMVRSWPNGQPPDEIAELHQYAGLAEEESERRSAYAKRQPEIAIE